MVSFSLPCFSFLCSSFQQFLSPEFFPLHDSHLPFFFPPRFRLPLRTSAVFFSSLSILTALHYFSIFFTFQFRPLSLPPSLFRTSISVLLPCVNTSSIVPLAQHSYLPAFSTPHFCTLVFTPITTNALPPASISPLNI